MDIQLTVKNNIGNTITVPNRMVLRVKTYLVDNYATGATAINVENAVDFSITNIALFETIGSENAEFKAISAVAAGQITVGALQFNHNRGSSVFLAEYDQMIIEKSATINGTYTPLGTYLIQATQQNTVIQDAAGTSTSYYRVKLRNSVTTNESAYSQPASALPYGSDSIAAFLFSTRDSFGVSPEDPIITTQFLLDSLNEARVYANNMMAGYKQAWRQEFDYPIKLLAGRNYVNLPADYDYTYTNNALLAVRYPQINGMAPYPLKYIDKKTWNNSTFSLKYAFTAAPATIGATSLQVDNIGDFSAAIPGTIFVATEDFSQDIIAVSYTGIDQNTNTFTGVTGITRAISSGVQLFAFPSFSPSSSYTIFDDRIVFNRPVPDVMQGQNIRIDYYTKMDAVTDINTVLQEPYKDIYRYYIRFAIKYRRDNKNTDPKTDPDSLLFNSLLTQWINNHYVGQTQTVIRRG